MSETNTMLTEAAEKLFTDLCTRSVLDAAEKGAFPQTLWTEIEKAGFPAMLCSEEDGGISATPSDAVAVLQVAGRFSVPAPIAETLLARWLIARAGLRPRSGPLTVAFVTGGRDRPGWQLARKGKRRVLRGTQHAVPWGSEAAAVVIVARDKTETVVAAVEPGGFGVEPRRNIAGEPRDTLAAEGVTIADTAVLDGLDADRVLRMAALFRAGLMAGALQRLLDLSVAYVRQRVQFGRPLAKFQAVQQQLAVLAGSVAASIAITRAAASVIERADGELMVAAARSRLADAVDTGNEIAHQVHGAMGFTREYELHLATRRLWAWRDEYGTAAEWRERLGRAFAGTPANDLWHKLSAVGLRTQ